jgi:hypothetical protein
MCSLGDFNIIDNESIISPSRSLILFCCTVLKGAGSDAGTGIFTGKGVIGIGSVGTVTNTGVGANIGGDTGDDSGGPIGNIGDDVVGGTVGRSEGKIGLSNATKKLNMDSTSAIGTRIGEAINPRYRKK